MQFVEANELLRTLAPSSIDRQSHLKCLAPSPFLRVMWPPKVLVYSTTVRYILLFGSGKAPLQRGGVEYYGVSTYPPAASLSYT